MPHDARDFYHYLMNKSELSQEAKWQATKAWTQFDGWTPRVPTNPATYAVNTGMSCQFFDSEEREGA
jgi:hypothetical protein